MEDILSGRRQRPSDWSGSSCSMCLCMYVCMYFNVSLYTTYDIVQLHGICVHCCFYVEALYVKHAYTLLYSAPVRQMNAQNLCVDNPTLCIQCGKFLIHVL